MAIISGDLFERFRFLQDSNTRLVVDFYAPIILENLHYYTGESFSVQDSFITPAVEIINRLARLGDFFICGSERQLDFWMGVLAANGRVNPRNFARDPSLRSLIDVVTIGFPDRPPRPKPMLRGIHPCVPPKARIVLWGGGIWEWLDPLTLVRAWPQVLQQYPQARLVFMGTRHPNPEVPRHRMVEKTEALAAEIGEKDRTILFYPWVPYEEREGLLCEADVGVTLHPQHVETRYSIRTRIMDYFWARLPVLVNQGDVVSEWVNEYGVGRVVPSLDVEATAQALMDLLAQPKDRWSAAFEPLLQRFSWQQVMQPLRQYCLHGDYAADGEQRQARLAGAGRTHFGRSQVQRVLYIYRQEGLGVLLHRIRRYAQTILSRP